MKSNCAGKDNFERINYLYQLSSELLEKPQNHQTLSFIYSNLIQQITKKTVQKLEPAIKKTLCKVCGSLLIAGLTARVRIRRKTVRYTCYKCNSSKQFKATADYSTWLEKPESTVEVHQF